MSRSGASGGAVALMEPGAAIGAIGARVQPVETERIEWHEAAGRVLAEPMVLDRPSPACDVSAMDGYALRLADLDGGALPVAGEVEPGVRAGRLEPGEALRIFTGAMVPEGAEAVVPREQVEESADRIVFSKGLSVRPGQHIRRRGENAEVGAEVCGAGCVITPGRLVALASCGYGRVLVRRAVTIGVIVTGNEVWGVDQTPPAWVLRDSNGPALLGMIGEAAWASVDGPVFVRDHPDAVREAASSMLERCDALVLTGGVSAGDHDCVPGVLRDLGCEVLFHKLAIRPGKPVLGAIDAAGRPVLGLPGNPVSVMVTASVFGAVALRARAGIESHDGEVMWVDVEGEASAPPSLTWYPAVHLTEDGRAALVRSRGSGDWVAAAGSDGFVEVPAGEPVSGRRRFRRWGLCGSATI